VSNWEIIHITKEKLYTYIQSNIQNFKLHGVQLPVHTHSWKNIRTGPIMGLILSSYQASFVHCKYCSWTIPHSSNGSKTKVSLGHEVGQTSFVWLFSVKIVGPAQFELWMPVLLSPQSYNSVTAEGKREMAFSTFSTKGRRVDLPSHKITPKEVHWHQLPLF
jgi:hypothetical protein